MDGRAAFRRLRQRAYELAPMTTQSSTLHPRDRVTPSGAAPLLSVGALAVSAADALALAGAVILVGHGRDGTVVYAALTFLVLLASGGQRLRVGAQVGPDLPWLLARLAVPLLVVAAAMPLLRLPGASLARLAYTASAAVVLVPVGRGVAYAVIRAARRRGHLLARALIVGAGKVAAEVYKALREHHEYGLLPVGFVDTPPEEGDDRAAMPLLGDPDELLQILERTRASAVIVAFGTMSEGEMTTILRSCEPLPAEVYVIPRFFEAGIAPAGLLADDVWGIPLVRLRRPALRPASRLVKRLFDVMVAGVALLVSAPVMLAIALAVHFSSPGPVLFRQLRVGRDGRQFELLKFRSMEVNDDADTTWSVAHDKRVTPLGRVLRRTFLDELPQFLNVLRGDMSLVGPRPERPHFAGQFLEHVPRYDDRHRVRVGMTGWAQVHGLRGDTPIPDRVRFDNYYIEHWSLWLDIVILARTVMSVIANRW
jgi:exopolysaccharide biosynthesis polyprenyl glycosylphosphotransferase